MPRNFLEPQARSSAGFRPKTHAQAETKNRRPLSGPARPGRPWVRPRQREKQMAAEHELVLTRLIDASRENLFRCWTEPSLLKQW